VREGETRGAEHGDEDLRHAAFPGEPVNDNRNPTGKRGDGVYVEAAGPGALTLASHDRQNSQLGYRERRGDPRRDEPGRNYADLSSTWSRRRRNPSSFALQMLFHRER
jgi:hypothetical protein